MEHYPDVCDNCGYICDVDNKYDKLTTNKLYDIYDLCAKCSNQKILIYNRKNYGKDKLFKYVKDEETMEAVLNQMNYQEFLNISNTYSKLKEIKENPSFKWQLFRQLSRVDELVKTFGDKIKYIRFTSFRFRRMGYIQFKAFKEHLYEIIYGKPYVETEKINNYLFEDVDEPDTDYPENNENIKRTCITCGTDNLLKNKDKCLKCEFSNKSLFAGIVNT